MKNKRFFGLIPAAGHSRRMGTHKLLMPWRENSVIETVVQAWTDSVVEHVVIVLRADDEALLQTCQALPVCVLALPNDTLDMKATIQAGLQHIEKEWSPTANDVCVIAPADLPKLTADLIDTVAFASNNKIVTPIYGQKNGHPTAFPWQSTKQVFELAANEGLNALIQRSDNHEINFDVSLRPRDIDTPEDYQREKQGD